MSTTAIVLSFLALGTAVFAIRGEYRPARTHVYIFKPSTTILIILLALAGNGPVPALYKWLILIGLIFCLGGDVFLMLPARYFIAGLASFLIGHIFYIVAFVTDTGFSLSWWVLPLLVYGVIIYRLLHPHLGNMRGPVTAYVITILLMAWQALGRWSILTNSGALLAALGAISFAISDSVLALDRFRAEFRSARLIVLTTYWGAQWLIAMSVVVGSL